MRMFRRVGTSVLAVVIGAAILAACGSSGGTGASSSKNLTVSTWGGSWTAAFKKWFAEPFTKATGVKFHYIVNGIDPDTPVLLQEQGGHDKIDIVDSGLGSELAVHHDLAKFPPALLSLMKKTSVPGAANPYWWTYGTVPNMIVCNPRIVKKCPTTPKEFWNVKAYPGERMMTNDPREMSVFALEAAGVSRAQIAKNPPLNVAQRMLKEIKPYVKVWASSGSQQQQTMTSGEVGIGVMWESRLVDEIHHGYSYWKASWNGAETESDYAFLVPKGAPDESTAFSFLKFIAQHPKDQAGFSIDLGTFTPSKDVVKYVPQSQLQWQPAEHGSQVFYWPSLPWVQEANKLQSMWQSTVG